MSAQDIKMGFYNYTAVSSTDITGSDENAAYPASNLADYRTTKVFRSTTAAANVVFDFKTTEEVNMFCVAPSFKDGFGFSGDLTIEANIIDSWGAPPYSTTLSVNQEFGIGFKFLTSSESYRFWRVSGTGSSYFELANMFIGKSFTPGKNPSFNWSYVNKDLSKSRENADGQRFISERGKRKDISFELKLLSSTELELLRDGVDYVGKTKPIWLVMDPEETFSDDKEFFAGQFWSNRDPSYTNIAFGLYNTRFVLSEVM